MIPVADALQLVLTHAARVESASVPLGEALGRTLRMEAVADEDSPPFDASAMDGYALRRADITGPLRVIGEAAAGASYAGRVGAGECVRIFTGAPVPEGADRVVKQEDVVRTGDQIRVSCIDGPDHIRRRGENRKRGDVVVPAGAWLGAPELAALAATGIEQPVVTRAPRCVHLVTGDELVSLGQTPAPGQIRDSNSTLVAALLRRHGAVLAAHGHAGDDLAAAQAAVEAMPAHEVLLISGGASVGDRDIARPLLEALGYTLHFQAVNLRPGKPLTFASRGSRLAFALPGNPVSHWVVFHLFVAPVLRALETGRAVEPVRLRGRIAEGGRLLPPDARITYWPATATVVAGAYALTLRPLMSSGDSSGLVGANALVPWPPGGFAPGGEVEFIHCP